MAQAKEPSPGGLLSHVRRVFRPNKPDHAAPASDEKAIANGRSSGVTDYTSNEKAASHSPGESGVTAFDVREDNIDRRRHVRLTPAWVNEEEYETENARHTEADARPGLLSRPTTATSAQHNHTPAPRQGRPRGRKLDYARDSHATMAVPLEQDDMSEMMALMRETQARPEPGEHGHLVSAEWIKTNLPDFDEPFEPAWLKPSENTDKSFWLFSPEKRLASWDNFMRILMRNPFVPFVFRLWLLLFVLAALGLGVNILQRSAFINTNPAFTQGVDTEDNYFAVCKQQTSTYLAIIVDCVAVPYIIYVTYDEYFNKPIGLRRSRDKIRLLFLDLLFVIFSAANLSLAFDTLTNEQWACFVGDPSMENNNNAQAARSTCVHDDDLCRHQRGLCAVLLLAEVSWVSAFAISIFRIVERIQR